MIVVADDDDGNRNAIDEISAEVLNQRSKSTCLWIIKQDWFQGYGGKNQHRMYRTSAATYVAKKPSVHTMPASFHCRSHKFLEHLGKCGMYRNHSLNTALDNSKV
ncbi:hypothetical protein DPMN_117730 [Dreissena polymorpha]|uniref:Uncharacterized protein n=1 Tax=Dreissena polymorpha TaxID=45954 RepID=A0A9D4GGA0_DREPO|nr:hypothetical protein DPMN_117730 [Dreissena polymorpha]